MFVNFIEFKLYWLVLTAQWNLYKAATEVCGRSREVVFHESMILLRLYQANHLINMFYQAHWVSSTVLWP